METDEELACGLEYSSVPDIQEVIVDARKNGYTFVCLPLFHPRFKREFINEDIAQERKGICTRTDFALRCKDWEKVVVGKLSPYIKVDSTNYNVRKSSEATLEQELSWATYLRVCTVMIDLPIKGPIANLARIINAKLKRLDPFPSIVIRVPMVSPAKISATYRDTDEGAVPESLWSRWNELRTLCDTDGKLAVALEVTDDLASDEELDRWKGEPLKFVILNTRTFITNRSGFPVLAKGHQEFVRSMIYATCFIISGVNRHRSIQHYHQYLHFMWQSSPLPTLFSSWDPEYNDLLQIPLQPLMDNLDSYTYEVFEKDPVKYSKYQCAIRKAITDKLAERGDSGDKRLVIMVVGAGRGPLVRASLSSAELAGATVKVYAVEKNLNATVSLQTQKAEVWGDSVEVINCDMRTWNAPEKADILISELLGSLGDNELSPECLDGAQKFLKDDGISIPKSYTSYVCPIQSHKLWKEARLCTKVKDPFEQLYVVHQTNIFRIAPIKRLFAFEHPNRAPIIDNSRYECLKFDVDMDCVLHGFSGYFETVLYGDVILSIIPETHSNGLFSWFPIYLPIKEPVQLKRGDILEAYFWRMVSKKTVWYEWCIGKPVSLPIHNPNGRTYVIGLES